MIEIDEINELLSIMDTRIEKFCRYILYQRMDGFPNLDRAWSNTLINALSLDDRIDIEIDHGYPEPLSETMRRQRNMTEEEKWEEDEIKVLEDNNIFAYDPQRFMIFYIDDGLLNKKQQKRYIECLTLLGTALLHTYTTKYDPNTIGPKPFFHLSSVDLNVILDPMNYVFDHLDKNMEESNYLDRNLFRNIQSYLPSGYLNTLDFLAFEGDFYGGQYSHDLSF